MRLIYMEIQWLADDIATQSRYQSLAALAREQSDCHHADHRTPVLARSSRQATPGCEKCTHSVASASPKTSRTCLVPRVGRVPMVDRNSPRCRRRADGRHKAGRVGRDAIVRGAASARAHRGCDQARARKQFERPPQSAAAVRTASSSLSLFRVRTGERARYHRPSVKDGTSREGMLR